MIRWPIRSIRSTVRTSRRVSPQTEPVAGISRPGLAEIRNFQRKYNPNRAPQSQKSLRAIQTDRWGQDLRSGRTISEVHVEDPVASSVTDASMMARWSKWFAPRTTPVISTRMLLRFRRRLGHISLERMQGAHVQPGQFQELL